MKVLKFIGFVVFFPWSILYVLYKHETKNEVGCCDNFKQQIKEIKDDS